MATSRIVGRALTSEHRGARFTIGLCFDPTLAREARECAAMSILRQSHDLELVERMAGAGWNANPGRPAALTWACRESALMRKEAYELRQMMQAALRVVHAAYALDQSSKF